MYTHMNNLVLTKRWLDIVINFYNTVILLAVSKALWEGAENSKQGNLLFYGFEVVLKNKYTKPPVTTSLKTINYDQQA